MPVLKHAKKKMRQDKKRTVRNKRVRVVYREMLKIAKASPTQEAVSDAFSALDRAVKQHIMHRNKAARLKSKLSKLLVKGAGEVMKETKSVAKKVSPKKKATKKTTK